MFSKQQSISNDYIDHSNNSQCQLQQQPIEMKIGHHNHNHIYHHSSHSSHSSSSNKTEKKKKFLDFYKSGKQKIMISFYNIYRNYPSSPPSFTNSPIWMMGQCYNRKRQLTFNNNNQNFSLIQTQPQHQPILTSQSQILYSSTSSSSSSSFSSSKSGIFNSLFNSTISSSPPQQQPQNITIQKNYCNITDEAMEVERFLEDFKSILWFSYRKDFPSIENTSITTDIGWGCMLRTGQMILARALLKHFYNNENIPYGEKIKTNSKYKKIMSWFCDYPSKENFYSIHQIVHKNKIITKYNNSKLKDFDIDSDDQDDWNNVDEWFAPTKIAVVLKLLVKSHHSSSIAMYVPSDGVVYKDRVAKICTIRDDQSAPARVPLSLSLPAGIKLFSTTSPSSPNLFVPSQSTGNSMEDQSFLVGEEEDNTDNNSNQSNWKSLIILVPVKLGLDKLNEIYFSGIKAMLQMPSSIGLIGGKPKQSFYFVGFQDEHIIYLDPHFVHDTIHPFDSNFLNSYHDCIPQKMHFSQIDPSMAFGFYCHTYKDFEQFCIRIKEIEASGFPILSIGETSPDYQIECDDELENLEEFEEEDNIPTTKMNLNLNNNTTMDDSSSDNDDLDGFTMVN
ncbi:autophagy protein 4 [Cavenderia fasciculata]|uniref:Cysteine protease n=1 Tax=Cavenderia fasciculata TaxID=261658 RepID=F4Q5K2_CACFS|nr:autophagy protein 4 [Cavenderia fasciculata]EGG17261.1 autophagy protein 4 [Cavenderia fasciculata]|eukprot:XP_004355745.1 autophagy protein 4 [Cavenderia fasciculata]